MAAPLSRAWCVAAVALVALLAGASLPGAAAQTTNLGSLASGEGGVCPLEELATTDIDYSVARRACDPAASDFCTACVCGIGTSLVTAFEAAGVTINGKPISELASTGDASELNSLLNNCAGVLGLSLLSSGTLSADALSSLAACDIDASSLSCAAPQAAPEAPAAADNAAAPRVTAAQGPVAAPAAPTPAPAASAAAGMQTQLSALLLITMAAAPLLRFLRVEQ